MISKTRMKRRWITENDRTGLETKPLLQQGLSSFGAQLLKIIHVFFELALSICGLVLVNHALGGEAVQVSLHII